MEERFPGTLVSTTTVSDEVMIGARGGTGGGVWSPLTITLGVELGVLGVTSYTGGTLPAAEVRGEALSDRWSGSEGALPYLDSKLGFLLTGFEYGLTTAKETRYKFRVEIILFLKHLHNRKEDSAKLCDFLIHFFK